MVVKTLGELAVILKGEVLGDKDTVVSNIAGIEDVEVGEMTWAEKDKFFDAAVKSPATAVLLPKAISAFPKPGIKVDNVRLSFANLLDIFNPPRKFPEQIHPTAIIGDGCKIAEGSYIGPYCVIEDGSIISKRVVLYPGVYIGPKCRIGENTIIHSNVTIREYTQIGKNVIIHAGTVVGSDGFGFVSTGGKQRKIPQVGIVVIEDDVEIGANCTIDRATTGQTRISRGTKMDNLIQIGHNVEIGEDCLLVAQSGVAGSSKVGNKVTLAGQSGVAGHLTVGSNSIVAARSVVLGDLPEGSFVSGHPARPHNEEMKVKAASRRLPELLKKVADLEKRLEALEKDDII